MKKNLDQIEVKIKSMSAIDNDEQPKKSPKQKSCKKVNIKIPAS